MNLPLLTGLVRDFVVAALGVLILAGASISDDLVAGILLLVTTGLALGTYGYQAYKARSGDGKPD